MRVSANPHHLSQLKPLLLVLSVATLLLAGGIPHVVQAQSSFPSIVSYRVTGTVNFTNPGGEQFWTGIPWTDAPLAASVSPGGGHTNAVLVKSANNGFDIFMLFRWNDTQGPSFASNDELYRAANGTLLLLSDQATSDVQQLFYNSTYYYQDRVAMLWYVGDNSSRQSSPVMNLGTDGALTGGAADVWHWQANPTDNNKSDSGFPGGYTDPVGRPTYPPDNLSFAEDDYTNMSGFFTIAGSFGQDSPNLDPYANPFVVLAGTQYSYSNKTWTVEMVRSFTTDATSYRVQLTPGSTYYAAFAVWQGKLGESAEMKSVSQWYTVNVSSTPPPSVPVVNPEQGVSPLLAVTVAVGTLLVGLVVGTALRSGPKETRGQTT